MLERIKFNDGSIQAIEEIPPRIRDKYKEVFEIEPQWLIKAAAYRGRWIDQSQSLNIFYGGTSGRVLSEIYQYAWNLGLKTTYYLRSLGASRIEKSTIDLAKYGNKTSVEAQAQGASTTSGGTPSTIMIQETVIATSMNGSIPSPAVFTEQISYAKIQTPMMEKVAEKTVEAPRAERPVVEMPKVVLKEPKKFELKAIEPLAATQTKRPQVEMMGEVCESCSA
jgi:ribonucleotide reductase alpha subunit